MFAAEMQEDPENVIGLFLGMLEPLFESNKAVSAVEASQLLLRSYLTRYGLADEETLKARPASLVAFHSAEDPYRGNLRFDRMADFAELGIGDLFNMSYDQYLRRPRHELLEMNAYAEKVKRRKNTANADALNKAEAAARQMGLPG